MYSRTSKPDTIGTLTCFSLREVSVFQRVLVYFTLSSSVVLLCSGGGMDAGQPADGVESEHHYHNLVRGSTYTYTVP